MAERPQLIAKCALPFASNWYLKPGETKSLIWTADAPWRPHGLRFGLNAVNLVLVQVKTGDYDNLVQSMPAHIFTPLMGTDEIRALRMAGLDGQRGEPTKGIVLDVPYTSYLKRVSVMDPAQWLNFATLRVGQRITMTVQNIGASPELVDGAVFFAKPYEGDVK